MNIHEAIIIRLMVPHCFTLPRLEAYGCHIKEEEVTISLSPGGEAGGDPTLSVVFPPDTRRVRLLSSLSHARKYLITLPDGNIFHEHYYLAFHQSIIYEPPPLPRYW
jgi:hypothetical protein